MTHDKMSLTPVGEDRLGSLDAYRGFVMICLAAGGFGIPATAMNFPDCTVMQFLKVQFEHVAWEGGVFWDLIQPSFMFMVGVALPYSYAKRAAAGEKTRGLLQHAIVRSIVLILLGIFLSTGSKNSMTNFAFVNVLTQIGLGYTILFLLWNRPIIVQLGFLGVLLGGYWAWFAVTPVVGSEFDFKAVGVPEDWKFLKGFYAHWQKNANPAATFDLWFLNLFPRPSRFMFNEGGYQTLNFVPSLGTMLIGLMTGEFIRGNRSKIKTFTALLVAGCALTLLGWAGSALGLCPLVKRIWTPTWTLYSSGWVLLMLAAFYGAIDLAGFKVWAWPLRVAGMNSIALYTMSQLLKGWTAESLQRHFGTDVFNMFGANYAPLMKANIVLLCFWLTTYWFYRQRIFFRI